MIRSASAALALLIATTTPAAAQLPEPRDWRAEGDAAIAAAKARQPITSQAKNAILFVADGMDVTTITASRILAGQQAGGLGEEHQLALDTLPYSALSKTYTTNAQTPDSAGTATAMLTGHKTKSGVIGVDETVMRGDCEGSKGHELPSLLTIAKETGRTAGIVSTARITHATPATVYAYSADRNWEADSDLPEDAAGCIDIATQLITTLTDKDSPLTLALGGGRAKFLPETAQDPEYPKKKGDRADGTDLTETFAKADRLNEYVWNAGGFGALKPSAKGRVLGLFEPSHMQYDADRAEDEAGEPSLAELTGFAIDKLDATGTDGYFLLVEGGRVDHAHHAGNAARALNDAISFDEAVRTAMEKTNPEETLIVVTADHGHTMVLQGYPHRGNAILGVVRGNAPDGTPIETITPGGDGKPYPTLAYGNGPGSPFAQRKPEGGYERPFVTDEEAQALDYRQPAAIPSGGETHGGQDVSIHARGPWAHLFGGVVEQSYIYYVIEEALTAE